LRHSDGIDYSPRDLLVKREKIVRRPFDDEAGAVDMLKAWIPQVENERRSVESNPGGCREAYHRGFLDTQALIGDTVNLLAQQGTGLDSINHRLGLELFSYIMIDEADNSCRLENLVAMYEVAIEVKAGMDPLALKRQYGDKLAFHGGINAVLFEKPDQLWSEMHRIIPAMKRGGGYWCSSDHSVPDSVSLETFREFVRVAKQEGSYA
jgi:hypothetical protein